MFVFRNQRGTAIELLVYDGQGFWLCHKRWSRSRLRWWPSSVEAGQTLRAHELQVLLCGGDPTRTRVPAEWRRVGEPAA